MGRHNRVSNGQIVLRYSGIDEVIHGREHVIGNVLPACIVCNRAKSDSRLEEWCLYIRVNPSKVIRSARRLGQRLRQIKMARTTIHGNGVRLWMPSLTRMYKSGECSVGDIADEIGVTVQTIYPHMRRLGLPLLAASPDASFATTNLSVLGNNQIVFSKRQ